MVRKKRVICPGHCYHVMMRGVSGRNIFEDDADRARFCLLLQYASELGNFSVHAFCLMSNHVHILLQPHNTDLSSGMHSLSFRYAQYFNKKIDRNGYLFQSRYKAILVENGLYLRRLIRYIHQNPVRANLVKMAADYIWSSHQAYITSFRGVSMFAWLKVDLISSLFGAETALAYNQYICADDTAAKIELDDIRNATAIGAYGNALFVEEYRRSVAAPVHNLIDSVPSYTAAFQNKSTVSELLSVINSHASVSLEELQSPCKNAYIVDARALFAWSYLKLQLGKKDDLVHLLRRNSTSILRLTQRINENDQLRQSAEEIFKNLMTT